VKRFLPAAHIATRSNSRLLQTEFCRQGIGLAVFAEAARRPIPGIVPIDLGEAPLGRDTYVGYHRDLRRLSRMRTQLDLVIERLPN
jgi:DNA-binding transcriptional LysR family regulator